MVHAQSSQNKVLVLLFHPTMEKSRANRALFDAARTVSGVDVRHVDAHCPDFKIDVAAEQALLLKYDTIVFQFPLYWYSAPALLKHWMDTVLTWGFAFGDGAKLTGKVVTCAITIGGPEAAYKPTGQSGHDLDDFLLPLEKTASYCGLRWQRPYTFFSSQQKSEEPFRQAAQGYAAALASLVEARRE
jgi:glutathione-regulated potassium-efflux system ancillary protein KefG